MDSIAVCPKCNTKEMYPFVTQEKQSNQDVNLTGPDRTNCLWAAKAPELQRAHQDYLILYRRVCVTYLVNLAP